MKRRLLPPLPCPALVLPGAAALALFLAGCPHPVGWSGEIPLESSSTSPSPVPKEPLSWAEAVNHMNNNPFQQGEIVYELSGSEEEGSPAPPLSYGSAGNCPEKVLIRGNGKKLILRYPGTLLTVGPGVEMTLENITLRGMGGNNAPLVLVDGGTLRIGEGVIIEKNKNEASEEEGLGGGVTVRGGGTFFMSGGEIR
ncbi:MAG: hypothetical protein LBQ44_05110, partial [Treponema sp.]|nr:hypothetical protein [Treponema sp.]